MLVLFTDYGWNDPYVGQLKAVLSRHAPGVPIIDLLHAVPDFNAHSGAHLLAALAATFPPGAVFVCVIDPGVGGPRKALLIEADGRYFVGPDNGLLSLLQSRGERVRCWHIHWRPPHLSESFHGRDLFAPIAAEIAAGHLPDDKLTRIEQPEVQFDPSDLPRIIFIDHYGNAWTGLRGGLAQPGLEVELKGRQLPWRRVFTAAEKGEAFWYVNSVGLVEIAVNRGSAAQQLELKLGDLIKLSASPGSRWH